MYECQRMVVNEGVSPILCKCVCEVDTFVTISALSKYKIFVDEDGDRIVIVVSGSKSPLYPDDHELSSEDLFEKHGYDLDAVISDLTSYIALNYTLDMQDICDILQYSGAINEVSHV